MAVWLVQGRDSYLSTKSTLKMRARIWLVLAYFRAPV